MSDDDKTYLTVPTSQRDLEERLARDFKPELVQADPNEVPARYATESTETTNYVGVSEEYMTHASDTEKPLLAESGPELESHKHLLDNQFAFDGTPPEENNEQTLGSGASTPVVYATTSGQGVKTEVLGADAGDDKAEASDAEKPKVSGSRVPQKAPARTPE